MPKKKTVKRAASKKTSAKKSSPALAKKTSAKKATSKKAASKKQQTETKPRKAKVARTSKSKMANVKQPAKKQSKTTAANKTARTVEINDHEALASLGTQVNRVLNANPQLAAMLFVNPVLAMQEAGVKLSRPMVHHILSRLRHPPALRERREMLEARLREALGVALQPNNTAWLSRILFETLKLQPLETHGLSPAYTPLRDAQTEKRLQALRPQRTHRYTKLTRHHAPGRLKLQELPPSVRRMDLDATLPELEPAKHTPKRVTLEMLYFYKDVNPVARDLLELAIIQRRGLRLNSRYRYRQIKEGKVANVFHRWFREVRFPESKA